MFYTCQYLADRNGFASEVTAHTDTDYEGRCLSAALHLDNWHEEEEEEEDSGESSGGSGESSGGSGGESSGESHGYANLEVEGGEFQVLECIDSIDCTGAVGEKLAKMHDDGVFEMKDKLKVLLFYQ